MLTDAPKTADELLARAAALSGLTLQEIAERCGVPLTDIHKGWIGQLLEIALGASAGSKPEPDFLELGIELKTLPIDQRGKPRESTFVCAIPQIPDAHWHGSTVQRKLATVLWIPILTADAIPLLQRRIASPLLWSPSSSQEQLLRQDWEELTELLMLGNADKVTAQHGQVLQVRPKAAHSKILRQNINSDGDATWANPRGFYLRAGFTEEIIRKNYLI